VLTRLAATANRSGGQIGHAEYRRVDPGRLPIGSSLRISSRIVVTISFGRAYTLNDRQLALGMVQNINVG
jgi:hypothetical protein